MKKSIFLILFVAILFVTLEPVSKLIAGEVSPYAITFWRFLIASFVLLPPAIIKIKKESIRIGLKDFAIMAMLGVLFICISMVPLQIGVKKADSPSLIAIIFSSNSIFTILFAMLILKDKMTKNKALALVLGVIGVLACTDFSSGTNLESALYGVFAAMTFSLYTVLSKKFAAKFGGIVQNGIVFLTGSVVLLIALLIAGVDVSVPLNPPVILNLCYLGFMVTGIGYALFFRSIEKHGAIMASLVFFIKPILTPFVSWIINGVVPDFKVFVAVLCVVGASWFATRTSKQQIQ